METSAVDNERDYCNFSDATTSGIRHGTNSSTRYPETDYQLNTIVHFELIISINMYVAVYNVVDCIT